MRRPIIVGTDFSPRAEKALGRAAWFARQLDRPLRVVYAFRDSAWANVRRLFAERDWAFGAPFETAQARANEVATALADQYAISVEVDVRVGTATQSLCAAAEQTDAELLVVGAYGENWRGDAYVGGTAHKLLNESPCPLLIVRHAPATAYDDVLIGVDFSAASIRGLQLAMVLVPASRLHVLHALVSLDTAQLTVAGADESFIESYHRIAVESAEKMLAELVQEHLGEAGTRVSIRVDAGNADAVIRAQAQATGSALAILGRHGQHAGKCLIGSNLLNVLHHADCDVLVVA